ncbi:MAG: hypothetical protein LBT87_05000 [Treponema sp.]|nr:hypothetical protein [Treponema sp.]
MIYQALKQRNFRSKYTPPGRLAGENGESAAPAGFFEPETVNPWVIRAAGERKASPCPKETFFVILSPIKEKSKEAVPGQVMPEQDETTQFLLNQEKQNEKKGFDGNYYRFFGRGSLCYRFFGRGGLWRGPEGESRSL